jgi:hypothetical protein
MKVIILSSLEALHTLPYFLEPSLYKIAEQQMCGKQAPDAILWDHLQNKKIFVEVKPWDYAHANSAKVVKEYHKEVDQYGTHDLILIISSPELRENDITQLKNEINFIRPDLCDKIIIINPMALQNTQTITSFIRTTI